MAIYVASLLGTTYLVKHQWVNGAALWILGFIPGLAIVGAFYAVGMLIVEEKDEFIRMLLVRQTLIATAIALSAATVWGFLENFGLVAHVDAYWVAILWFAGLGLGGLVNRLTHGASGVGC